MINEPLSTPAPHSNGFAYVVKGQRQDKARPHWVFAACHDRRADRSTFEMSTAVTSGYNLLLQHCRSTHNNATLEQGEERAWLYGFCTRLK